MDSGEPDDRRLLNEAKAALRADDRERAATALAEMTRLGAARAQTKVANDRS